MIISDQGLKVAVDVPTLCVVILRCMPLEMREQINIEDLDLDQFEFLYSDLCDFIAEDLKKIRKDVP